MSETGGEGFSKVKNRNRIGNLLVKLFRGLFALIFLVGFIYLSYVSLKLGDLWYGCLALVSLMVVFVVFWGDKNIRLGVKRSVQAGLKEIDKEEKVLLKTPRKLGLVIILLVCGLLIQIGTLSWEIVVALGAPTVANIGSSLLLNSYVSSTLRSFSQIWVYHVIPIVVLLAIFSWIYFYLLYPGRKSLKAFLTWLSLVIILTGVFGLVSNFTALHISKLVATWEMRGVVVKLADEQGLKDLGIIYDVGQINDRVAKLDKLPKIIGVSEDDEGQVVSEVFSSFSNRSTFYTKVLMGSIKQSSNEPKLPYGVVMMPNNTLLISKMDKQPIEAISPNIGKVMVGGYFNPKYIKIPPKLSVLGRQEYMKYREDEINKKLDEIDDDITDIQKALNTYSGHISKAKASIQSNQNGRDDSIAYRDSSYNNCKSAGYYSYYTYTFYRYYSDSQCDSKRAEWDAIIVGYEKNIKDWQAELGKVQGWYSESKKLKDLVVNYRSVVEEQKDSTPSELGIFNPPDDVKVVLESVSNKALADYLAIVVHEYLHYTSYVSEERTLPGFFEEGLTEYFTRGVLSKEVGTDTNVGYPVIVKIISKMANDIPRERLEDIYFTKDKTALISILDDKYGKDFYKDSEYYFNAIWYLPPPEALDVANDILFRMGGDKIALEDLYSSSSEFKDSTLKR